MVAPSRAPPSSRPDRVDPSSVDHRLARSLLEATLKLFGLSRIGLLLVVSLSRARSWHRSSSLDVAPLLARRAMPLSFTPSDFTLTLGIQNDGDEWKRRVLVDHPDLDAQLDELMAEGLNRDTDFRTFVVRIARS